MTNSLTPNMRIGQAAQASSLSTTSIRFYEQHGLLGRAIRSDNGYRIYSAQDIDRLRQIRTCRSLDMSLNEIQQLLSAPTNAPEGCAITSHVLQQHLQHLEDRITELIKLKNQLNGLIALCDHDPDSACPTQQAVQGLVPPVHQARPPHRRHV